MTFILIDLLLMNQLPAISATIRSTRIEQQDAPSRTNFRVVLMFTNDLKGVVSCSKLFFGHFDGV